MLLLPSAVGIQPVVQAGADLQRRGHEVAGHLRSCESTTATCTRPSPAHIAAPITQLPAAVSVEHQGDGQRKRREQQPTGTHQRGHAAGHAAGQCQRDDCARCRLRSPGQSPQRQLQQHERTERRFGSARTRPSRPRRDRARRSSRPMRPARASNNSVVHQPTSATAIVPSTALERAGRHHRRVVAERAKQSGQHQRVAGRAEHARARAIRYSIGFAVRNGAVPSCPIASRCRQRRTARPAAVATATKRRPPGARQARRRGSRSRWCDGL